MYTQNILMYIHVYKYMHRCIYICIIKSYMYIILIYTLITKFIPWDESESHSVVSDFLQPRGLYTVLGILQAKILEWVAIPFSRVSYHPWDQTKISHIEGGFTLNITLMQIFFMIYSYINKNLFKIKMLFISKVRWPIFRSSYCQFSISSWYFPNLIY